MDERLLKALFEPRRYLLMQRMAERTYCVRALAKLSALSEPAVSQHLKVLREAGLVYGVKRGYYTHYGLDKAALGRLIDELCRLRDAERRPCSGPYYGCAVSQQVGCPAYIPPEQRGTD